MMQSHSIEYQNKKNKEYWNIFHKFLSDYPELRNAYSGVTVHWPTSDDFCGKHFNPSPEPVVSFRLYDFMKMYMEMKLGRTVSYHEVVNTYDASNI